MSLEKKKRNDKIYEYWKKNHLQHNFSFVDMIVAFGISDASIRRIIEREILREK